MTMDKSQFFNAAGDGDVETVRRGLEEGMDINMTSVDGRRPVDCSFGLDRSTRLLIEIFDHEIKSYDSTVSQTETRKQAEYSELQLVTSLGSVEETTVKLFLCGDGQVGKTSLRAILKKTGIITAVLWNIRSKFRKEDAFNPTPGVHVSRKNVRGIGRLSVHDFAGQAQFYVTHAMLLRTTNAIFPVVYKITDVEKEQKRQVHGWLSFIHCSNADPNNRPRIVLIASHADKLQDREGGRRRATAMVNLYRNLFKETLEVSQEVFLMNCMEARSPEIQRLRDVLAVFRDDMLKIIYFRGKSDIVVLKPQWLCSYVFGRLLANDNFPIDKIERTAEDYVTLEELTRVFGTVTDIPLLIKLLKDFQLCHTYDGYTFILPNLLEQEIDKKAWSPVSSQAVYFGIQICCRTEIDSFSCDLFPRLQTLLMQAHPSKLHRPLLWKNSVKCTDGKAEALLQITQNKRQLNIFVRSNDGDREDCKSIMDLLTDMAYKLVQETSPGARSRDMVLSALDLREHTEPHAYSREEAEGAAGKGENLVHPQRNVPEKVTDLLLHLEHLEMDETAWSPVSSKAVYFGIQIRCCSGANSFSTDLFPKLQTLLMQAHPGKLNRPLLWPWKNSAKWTDGKAEAMLQITQDKCRLNIFARSIDGNMEDCKSIMDLLTNMVHSLINETNPGARSSDMVLSALDLREHSPQPHAYSREEVEEAAAKGENVVHPRRNVPERAKDILLHLGNLKGMLGRVARKRPQLVETLRHIHPILDHLRQDDVINMEENDRIRAARTPQDAARELLDILEAKGEEACVGFHSALQQTDKFAASLLEESPMSEEGATAS
uniref:CARD domain-containing protein n=1 Tax=Branchiostoma floridae TaxID=7739 RepID=C3Y129_BRAFL|eukprot:XP_002609559.1 hypothetical protein BRAFLDRAFT_101917 [Branchiostoma floridae]